MGSAITLNGGSAGTNESERTVLVRPGARWGNISEMLDPLGLAVVGGRVIDVGVAGLTIGGISTECFGDNRQVY